MSTQIILPADRPRDDAIARLVRFCHQLDSRKPWKWTCEPYKATRSGQQNRYLHGVCYKLISDATGYEPEDVAEYLLGTYFGWKDKKVPKTPRNPEGFESVPIRSTTRNEDGRRDVLSWEQFAEYVAFIQRFAAGKGIYIPDPDPQWKETARKEAA